MKKNDPYDHYAACWVTLTFWSMVISTRDIHYDTIIVMEYNLDSSTELDI